MALCFSLPLLSSVPSSHLDPAGAHSANQGSGATTPEHPSVIDPLMEQDEGPGTPPAKQSTPSSRSADVCSGAPICPQNASLWALDAGQPGSPQAADHTPGLLPFLPSSISYFLSSLFVTLLFLLCFSYSSDPVPRHHHQTGHHQTVPQLWPPAALLSSGR